MSLHRTVTVAVLAALISTVALAPAQQPKTRAAAKAIAADATPNVATTHGVVVSADKTTLTIKPRSSGGQFEKEMVLQIAGTSRLTQLSFQTQGGKTSAKQTDVDAKDLKADQVIAVIYSKLDAGPVVLTATVVPAAK